MRFWEIAVVFFAFSLSVSLVNTMFYDTGIFNKGIRLNTGDETTQSLNATITNLNTSVGKISSQSSDFWSLAYTASLLFSGITLFVQTLGNATVMLPWMLMNLYVPAEIAWTISGIVWIVYGMAFLQIISGRMLKGAE